MKSLFSLASVLFVSCSVFGAEVPQQNLVQLKCTISLREGLFDPNIISELNGTHQKPVTVSVTIYPSALTVNDASPIDHASQIKLENGLFAVMKAVNEPATIYSGVSYKAMTTIMLSIYNVDPSQSLTPQPHRTPHSIYTALSKTDTNPGYAYFAGEALLAKLPSTYGPLPSEKIATFGAVCIL